MYKYYSSYESEDFLFNHAVKDEAHDYPLHSHDVCELLFLKKGNVSYMVEGRVYQLAKNCLVISRPSETHSVKFHGPTVYERYNILFDEKKLASDIYHRLPSNIDVINFDGNELVCSLFNKISYYSENFEGDTLKTLLFHLTEEILYNVLLSSKNFEQSSICTLNPIINQALKYINDNITRPLSIDAICEELYITKSHLHHLFIKHLKISPKKYITAKKLNLAQRELRSGVKPSDVYLTYGFSDYSTFYRDYKQYFGHSPSDELKCKIVREIIS